MATKSMIFIGTATTALSACVVPQSVPSPDLVGTGWRVVEMDGMPIGGPSERPLVLAFGNGGKVSGQACNQLGGDYQVRRQQLLIGPLAMTEMSCGETLDRVESRFLQILSVPVAYQLTSDGGLRMGDPRHPVLRLIATAAETRPLVTGLWGGRHVGLQLKEGGGNVEFDCGIGQIEGPIVIDRAGRFSAVGFHTPGLGGPARLGEEPPHFPASYRGEISGEIMTLTIDVPERHIHIGPLSLRRNAAPVLVRCL